MERGVATIFRRTVLSGNPHGAKGPRNVLWNGEELKRIVSEEMQSIQMEGEHAEKEQGNLAEEKTEPLFSELEQETVKTIDIGERTAQYLSGIKKRSKGKGI